MSGCTLCPRNCGAERTGSSGSGVCSMGEKLTVARAALHFWEEPCLSGTGGSGTVFFSGCALGCVYCQNRHISAGRFGAEITVERLREIYRELIAQGAHNINLVTPMHFAPAVLRSLEGGLPVPVVCNTGGYESVETVKLFRDAVQIWLPDMKYADASLAARYSKAPDYPQRAKAAILQMYAQTGPCRFDSDGMLRSGVIIRHLVLPGCIENTFAVIDWVAETFPRNSVIFSLMSQFTPTEGCRDYPELCRGLTQHEHEAAAEYMLRRGITSGYTQDRGSARESFIPPFDLTGVHCAPEKTT